MQYHPAALRAARVSLLVIDACRDNPFPKQGTRTIGASRGLVPPEASRGQAIILSAGRGQKALDRVPGQSAANGLFTHEFVQVIRQPGLDVRSALVQVRDKVEDRAARDNHEQRPSLVDELRGNFYIFVAPGGSVTINPPQPARPAASAEKIEDDAWAAAARIKLAALRAPASQPPTAARPQPQPPAPAAADQPQMVDIPAGSFVMGSPAGEQGRRDTEGPQRNVRVGAFALGATEVTVGQFRRFVQASGYQTEAERNAGGQPGCWTWEGGRGEYRAGRDWRNPGFTQVEDHPVVCVSWNDAQAYVRWLSQTTGQQWRLPSEAEWEYAARAGTNTRYYWGEDSGSSAICQYANVADATARQIPGASGWTVANCSDGHAYTAPVGGRQANGWGLYDMTGNVREWTEDCWNANYNGAPSDGSAWRGGDCSLRVDRGGGWFYLPGLARSALRDWNPTTFRGYLLGFRVARTLP